MSEVCLAFSLSMSTGALGGGEHCSRAACYCEELQHLLLASRNSRLAVSIKKRG